MRKVEVVAYDAHWMDRFREEAEQIEAVLGDNLVAIHHIGSTSVPGLVAKPIIDIMPVVKDIAAVDPYKEAMETLGYEAKGEFGIPGRRFFKKGGDARTHHVHVFEEGSPDSIRHLAFRDYLREHPDAAKAYGKLKQNLARQFPHDMEAYIEGKHHFVTELEQKAVTWYTNLRP
ncbi:GrpB family protein [Thalassobacillus sp. B23F22_16]|uniref:GrpB family protein n=1 Tax=Thalassobacillus sp. B23F22_16 TaxID=3459513 RepID=UPI00373F535F